MKPSAQFALRVPVAVRQEGKWFYSSCGILDIHSQGLTKKEAIANLVEALQIFVMSCFSRGTLDQVLRDCGFEAADDGDDKLDDDLLEVPVSLFARSHAPAHAY